jgi:hypothetical protein
MNMLGITSESTQEDARATRDVSSLPPETGRATSTASFAEQMRALRTMHQRAIFALPSLTIPISESRDVEPITLDRSVVEAMSAPLPVTRDLRARSREAAPEVEPDVANTLAEIHSNAKYTMETHSTECQNNARENGEAVKNANGSRAAVEDFRVKMEAERDKTKSEVNKTIDEWYAKATDLGEKHPSQQTTIMNGMEATVGTVVTALGQIGTALMNIACAIIGALQDIWNAVQKFFAPVEAIIALF